MDKLTIEEKAKAYDKAIDKAKKELDACGSQDCDAARQIFRLFPELLESESKDERIRKTLISYFAAVKSEEIWDDDISFGDIVAWLEKQDGQKPQGKSALKAIKEEKVDNANKVEPKDYNGIDPYFGKPVDKVESKFKVGDWVVENGVNGNSVQITSFEEDKGVGIKVWFSNGTGTWVDYLKGYHKWTIDDAKDGDVLADNLGVILFKGIGDNNVINLHAYFSGIFSVQKDEEYWGYVVNCTLSPATKEQCERFFAAMHDAGYEWDAEKKELKKISQRIISAEAKEAMYGKPTAWSEEDENILEAITYTVKNSGYSHCIGVSIKVMIDWLKSLKERIKL